MRRTLSVCIALSLFPHEALAQVVRLSVAPLTSAPIPQLAFPVMSSPFINPSPLPSPSALLSLSSPSPLSVTPQAQLQALPALAVPVAVAVAVKAAQPQPPQAAPHMDFDGRSPHYSAASSDTSDKPDAVPAAPRIPRRRDVPQRFTSRLARWTGAAAVYSIYRDGVLVQRYASRLSDQSQPPSRRAASARLLASLGRIESVPTLGYAQETDSSPRVRRAALAALLNLTLAAEPKLVRTLKTNPFSGSREAAASSLSWLVRHSASPEAVAALAAAAALDPSEDVRLAAIRALTLAKSPKALASLEWMLSGESRPHMRSSLELAVNEARGRVTSRNLSFHAHTHHEPGEDLADARGPLHAVALKRALAVSVVFVAIELAGGFVTGNVALKADAMHLAADQLINAAALFSIWMARRPPNSRKSYGYLKVEAVVGLLGSAAIAFMGFEMGTEAWHRFFNPGEAATWTVALFALASLAANAFSAVILWRHHGESLSVKGAFLHSLTDAIGSFGVILSVAAAILLGWAWVEPAAVVLIVLMIAKTAWSLGKPAWNTLIDAVPEGVDLDRVEADLLAIPGAAVVKDLHVWALNSQTTALTATVFIRPGASHDAVLASAKAMLLEKHKIRKVTVQVETLPNAAL